MADNNTQNNKRIAKNTMLLYIRMLITMVVTLYTSRIILKVLGVQDFGIYNVVGGVVTMFGFLSGCMSTATQRYITFSLGKNDNKALCKVFSISIILHLMVALCVLLAAETFGLYFLNTQMKIPTERLFAAFCVYQCSIIASIIMIISIPYNALIVAHERMSAFAYISIIDVSLKLLIVVILPFFPFDRLIFYAVLILIVQILNRFFYTLYCRRNFKSIHFSYKIIDKDLMKEMLQFGGWSIFGNFAYVGYTQGINVLLSMFFGPTVNAARAISVQVQNAINMFSMNFQTALNPQITKLYAINDIRDMENLVFKSCKISFFLLFLISLPILINTEYVLQLWLSEVPEYTIIFVRLMLLITILDATANPFMVSASATGRVRRYHTIIGGTLLMVLPISFIFLCYGYSPVSTIIVHLFLCIIAFIGRFIIVKSMIDFRLTVFIREVVLKCLCVILTAAPICFFISRIYKISFITFVIETIIIVFITSILIYYLGFSKNEKTVIRETIIKYYRKFFS